MKRIASITTLLTIIALSSGCSTIPPGYEGIKVKMWGGQRGVQDYPIITGMVTYNPWNERIYTYPVFLQNVVWTRSPHEGGPNDESITFNSLEGAVMNADIAISYSIEPAKVPEIFVSFRQPIETVTDVFIRSKVRDAFSQTASKMKVVDIFGQGKSSLEGAVLARLNADLNPMGFTFHMVSIVGAIRVSDEVHASIDAVIQATQRAIEAENKVRQSKAEAEQAVATANGEAQSTLVKAQAQAQANLTVARSLTPELVQWQAIQTWDGHLPSVTGGAMPFIDVTKAQSPKR